MANPHIFAWKRARNSGRIAAPWGAREEGPTSTAAVPAVFRLLVDLVDHGLLVVVGFGVHGARALPFAARRPLALRRGRRPFRPLGPRLRARAPARHRPNDGGGKEHADDQRR